MKFTPEIHTRKCTPGNSFPEYRFPEYRQTSSDRLYGALQTTPQGLAPQTAFWEPRAAAGTTTAPHADAVPQPTWQGILQGLHAETTPNGSPLISSSAPDVAHTFAAHTPAAAHKSPHNLDARTAAHTADAAVHTSAPAHNFAPAHNSALHGVQPVAGMGMPGGRGIVQAALAEVAAAASRARDEAPAAGVSTPRTPRWKDSSAEFLLFSSAGSRPAGAPLDTCMLFNETFHRLSYFHRISYFHRAAVAVPMGYS